MSSDTIVALRLAAAWLAEYLRGRQIYYPVGGIIIRLYNNNTPGNREWSNGVARRRDSKEHIRRCAYLRAYSSACIVDMPERDRIVVFFYYNRGNIVLR